MITHDVLKQLMKVDIKIANNSRSTSQNMRNELNGLIKTLENTVFFNNLTNDFIRYPAIIFQNSHFIRCIRPNVHQLPKVFDTGLVLQQLKSANMIVYAKFMQIGFAKRVSIDSLNETYKQYMLSGGFRSTSTGIQKFYTKLLLSIGFKLKDFKFGINLIFFRAQNSALIDRLLGPPSRIELNIINMRRYNARTKFRTIVFGIMFLNGL